jgi:hypothetical protein
MERATRFELATLTLAIRKTGPTWSTRVNKCAGQCPFLLARRHPCLTLFLGRLRDFCGIAKSKRKGSNGE